MKDADPTIPQYRHAGRHGRRGSKRRKPIKKAINRHKSRAPQTQGGEAGEIEQVRLTAWLTEVGAGSVERFSLIELNPFGRCTVKIATRRTMAIGTVAKGIKAPI